MGENVKRKKLPTLRSLKNKLDLVFSSYIRKRDANEEGMGKCVTCGNWSLLQCGHFIPRQHQAFRWDNMNAHGQCARCNMWLHGNLARYTLFMEKRYGVEVVDDMLNSKHTTVKHSRDDLERLIKLYQEMT